MAAVDVGTGGGDRLDLEQRGLIGDTATAALAGADGTIDWYCPRRFDAPASLFALLDPEGGAVRVGPAGTGRAAGRQTYDERTNILRTRLPGVDGELEVADFMPWDGTSARPPGRIIRIVTATRGEVGVEIEVTPGTSFGPARRVSTWSAGLAFDDLVVRTGVAVDGRRAETTLRAGERLVVTIDLTDPERHHQPLAADAALRLLDDTAGAWRRHLDTLTYDGPYRPAVERSLLALKALTYHGTGALVASATTSLPHWAGGERNWDHRYAWVRDACALVAATSGAGLSDEAAAATGWLSLLLEGTGIPMSPVCLLDGDEAPGEDELGLAGWRRSQPVRTGTAATDHHPLDIYADLAGIFHAEDLLASGPMLERWDVMGAAADWVADHWHEPDTGTWDLRSPRRHLLASKVACWYALDRVTRLARALNPLDLDAVGWFAAARDVLAWLEASRLAAAAARLVDVDDPALLDASLLRLPWTGPWPPTHEVVQQTVDRILRNLSTGAHVSRYPPEFDDGLPGREGAYTPCSFWAVRALAAIGRWDEAHERMEILCGLNQPLGLLSEEVDATSATLLGNLPFAASHLALVNAALALENGPR